MSDILLFVFFIKNDVLKGLHTKKINIGGERCCEALNRLTAIIE